MIPGSGCRAQDSFRRRPRRSRHRTGTQSGPSVPAEKSVRGAKARRRRSGRRRLEASNHGLVDAGPSNGVSSRSSPVPWSTSDECSSGCSQISCEASIPKLFRIFAHPICGSIEHIPRCHPATPEFYSPRRIRARMANPAAPRPSHRATAEGSGTPATLAPSWVRVSIVPT